MNIAWLQRYIYRQKLHNQAGSATIIAMCVVFIVIMFGITLSLVAKLKLYDVRDYERMTSLRYQAESQLEAQAKNLAQGTSLSGALHNQNGNVTINGNYLKLESTVSDERGGQYTRYGLMKKEGEHYVWQGWSR